MSIPSTLQSVAWEAGLQAVRESVNCEAFETFAQHLRDTAPLNSPATRQRYASLIIKRLFPERRLDGLHPRAWRAYTDEQILTDLARVTTLEAEPVIARFAVEHVLSVPPGTQIERAALRDYISATYGSFKSDSHNRLRSALLHMGFLAVEEERLIAQAIPRPANALLILLHARLAPTPRIVRLADILSPAPAGDGEPGQAAFPFWRLLGIREEDDVRSMLRDAEAAGLIAKYAVVDQLEQITTRYSVDEYLAGARRL